MINSKWKRVLENDTEFSEIMLSSVHFREKLSELLEEEISNLEVVDDYDNPNWQLLQAEANGKRKAYKLVCKLINN
jgi:hypothetical protein